MAKFESFNKSAQNALEKRLEALFSDMPVKGSESTVKKSTSDLAKNLAELRQMQKELDPEYEEPKLEKSANEKKAGLRSLIQKEAKQPVSRLARACKAQ
ncbi:hypothetical protein ACNO7T_15735 [Vibrio campbellii]